MNIDCFKSSLLLVVKFIFQLIAIIYRQLFNYSQTRIKNSLGDEKKVSFIHSFFISCPINVESLTCIKAEE